MAKKKKEGGIRKAIKAAGPNISRSEMESITKAASGNASKALNQITKAGANLASGAANMLIKQQQKAPAMRYDPRGPFGTSKIGQALQQMAGSPAQVGPRNPQSGAPTYNIPGTAPQMMIGGTVIRPGGRVAVRPMGAAPAVGDTTAATTAAAGDGTVAGDGTTAGGDAFDFQSMLDALTAMQQPAFDMTGLEDMFQTQFDQLSSQFDQMNPLRLAQLGRAYGADAIRARQNIRKTRQDYRRGIPSMALGQALANMAIGGGVTL